MNESAELSTRLEKQNKKLWFHLPKDEVKDDEPIDFKTDDEGSLMVRTKKATYIVGDGRAWKYEAAPNGGRKILTEFVEGERGIEVPIDDEWNIDDEEADSVRKDLDRLLSEIRSSGAKVFTSFESRKQIDEVVLEDDEEEIEAELDRLDAIIRDAETKAAAELDE